MVVCFVCFATDLNSFQLKAKYSKKKKLENALSEFKFKKAYTKVAKIWATSATVNVFKIFDSEVVENPGVLSEYSCGIYKYINGQILYLKELDKWSKAI